MNERNIFFNPITGEIRFDYDYESNFDIPKAINWQSDASINDKVYGFKNLTLNLTMDCNLQCKYCWQNHGYGHDMTRPVIDKWLDFFLNNDLNSPNKILYFGGEPFLRLDLVKHAAERVAKICRERDMQKPQQQIFTNATLLTDEALEIIKKEGIFLILSIDGDDDINSRYRVDNQGRSVQEQINLGVQNLKRFNIPFGVCCTLSEIVFNVDKTIKYIIDEIQPLSLEFNVRYDKAFMNKHGNPQEIDFSSFFRAWDLIRHSTVANINFKKRILPLALKKPLKNSSSGSKNKLSVMPNGNVSPFNSAVQFPDLQIKPVGNWIIEFRKQWDRDILYNKKCQNCKAAFICGQGSAFSSFLEYGDFNHTPFLHCEYCSALLTYVLQTIKTELKETVPQGYVVSKRDIIRIFNIGMLL